jgi:DNA repair protein RecO
LVNHVLQLINLGTREKEADRILYKELRAFLTFLNNTSEISEERAAFLLSSFALKILAILGYRPELNTCLHCQQAIRPGDFFWHSIKGGVVCRDCALADMEQWFSAKPLTDDVLKLLRFSLVEKFGELLKPRLNGKTIEDFHETVESLLVAHFPSIPAVSLRSALIL